jgi:hypothetical protein
MTTRLATAVVVSLLVFATAVPAVGMCCVAKPGNRMAAMHASMPCCAEHCKLSSPDAAHNRDLTAITAPEGNTASAAVAATAELASPASASIAVPATGQSLDAFSPPPPFLLNSQFRI